MATSILAPYADAQIAAIRDQCALARDGDPESVHDARVAVRRLRGMLRTFEPMLRGVDVDAVRGDLRWLGTALGRVRDAQVMSERLLAAVAAEPYELIVGPVVGHIQSSCAAEVARALDELGHDLNDPRFAALLTTLDRLAGTELVRNGDPSTAKRLARKALRRADRRLATADADADLGHAGKADAERDVALHDARRACKRARYAVETLNGAGGRCAARLVKRLTVIQDVLGVHHDSVVTRQRLRALGMQAHLDGENVFTYGLLYARQGEAAARCLGQLPAAVRRARTRSVRAWLNG